MDYAVLKKNFENHRFHTSYFETTEEAAAYLSDQIKGEKVGFGGSITAKEMNLFEVLGKDNEVIWHWARLLKPEATLKELGEDLEPPVGKSGVNHRLRKLGEMAEKLREQGTET